MTSKNKKCLSIKQADVDAPTKLVTWYDPTPDAALDRMVRAACNLGPLDDYLLVEPDGSAVALSTSLPTNMQLELVRPTKSASRQQVSLALDAGVSVPGVDAIVIIDPVTTGAVLAHKAVHRNRVQVVVVWSDVIPEELRGFVAKGFEVPWAGTIQHETRQLKKTVSAIHALGLNVRAVLVGCETGVLLGDMLSEAMGVATNGTAHSGVRRNKFKQQEAVRDAGLNACKQVLANSRQDVEAFLNTWNPKPYRIVVKPVEGAGSDGVSICNSPDEVREAYRKLEGTKNILGLTNYSVLLQEYLCGDEYVVDTVSRDGVHKVCAVWRYDKRRYNGAPFVYFGMELMQWDKDGPIAEMVKYTLGVLDAMHIKHGAMHSEVKYEKRGPVLIEVNCRLHGGEGTWAPMAEACLGFSAVDASLDAALDPAAFAMLPSLPAPANFSRYALECKLRSPVEGILKTIDEKNCIAITQLRSFLNFVSLVDIGKPIAKTVDAVTATGIVNLAHKSMKVLREDYETVQAMIEAGLYEVEPHMPEMTSLALEAEPAETA